MREGRAFSLLLIPVHPEIPFQFVLCAVLLTAEHIYLGCAVKIEPFLSSLLSADPGLPACPCTQVTAVIVNTLLRVKDPTLDIVREVEAFFFPLQNLKNLLLNTC